MAKYTELFSEYIQAGGQYPAAFKNVQVNGDNLSDLFMTRYGDREIGFETPALFALKFEGLAAELIPELESGLQAHSGALTALNDPQTVHIKTGAIARVYGQRKRNTYEQPTASPVTGQVQLVDTDSQNIVVDHGGTDTETYNAVTDTDKVKGVAEGVKILEALSTDRKNFLQVWLDKFDVLFMQIF